MSAARWRRQSKAGREKVIYLQSTRGIINSNSLTALTPSGWLYTWRTWAAFARNSIAKQTILPRHSHQHSFISPRSGFQSASQSGWKFMAASLLMFFIWKQARRRKIARSILLCGNLIEKYKTSLHHFPNSRARCSGGGEIKNISKINLFCLSEKLEERVWRKEKSVKIFHELLKSGIYLCWKLNERASQPAA